MAYIQLFEHLCVRVNNVLFAFNSWIYSVLIMYSGISGRDKWKIDDNNWYLFRENMWFRSISSNMRRNKYPNETFNWNVKRSERVESKCRHWIERSATNCCQNTNYANWKSIVKQSSIGCGTKKYGNGFGNVILWKTLLVVRFRFETKIDVQWNSRKSKEYSHAVRYGRIEQRQTSDCES